MTGMLRVTPEEYAAILARTKATPSAVPVNKYRNIKTIVDGVEFSSRKEAKRYRGLMLDQQAGKIHGLQLQQAYSIDINGVHVCDYVADFTYWLGDKFVVLDVKGVRTPAFKLKKKLMLAVYGVVIEEY